MRRKPGVQGAYYEIARFTRSGGCGDLAELQELGELLHEHLLHRPS